jgi:curved DNA-binding protein CbpA
VAEAYEVLRDPLKRRQYDRAREGGARAGARRPRAWFGSTDGFGDDLWSDTDWGGGEGWRFRNPFDVFKEFFGERDPWADMTPRTRRQDSMPRTRSRSSFWSMNSDPFFSSPFSSTFFDNRSTGSLFDQRRSPAPAPLERVSRGVEIKIHGFTDDEDSSTEEEEEEEEVLIGEEVVVEDQGEDEEDEVEVVPPEEDVDLREAIRLSLEQEEERKRHEQTAAAQTDEDLEEAIRRSLEDMQRDDWMEVVEEAGGRTQPQHTAGQQRLPALH